MVESPTEYFFCDRFWPTTFAYGAAERKSPLTRTNFPKDMPRPPRIHLFLLRLPEKTRMARLRRREQTTSLSLTEEEGRLENDPDLRERINSHFLQFEGMVEIDASQSPEQIVEQIKTVVLS